MEQLLYFAHEAAEPATSGPNLLSALGIDGTLLLMQAGAFLVLLLLLAKFAYPPILKAIENRRATIEAGIEKAKKAEADLQGVEQKVTEIIRTARTEASDIIAQSKHEATSLVEAAEKRASKRAEHIVAEAHAQMTTEVESARTMLRKEAAQLVVAATEKVVKEKIDARKDAALIETSLKKAEAAHD